jgi:transcriptional regulator with XRE-family HTH domain
MTPGDDPSDLKVSARFGVRLRDVRRQLHLSLQEVEEASNHEFKASVVGAYERGDRAMSVDRLQRLARFYRVPIAEMIPHDDERAAPSEIDHPVTIDLVALRDLDGPDGRLLGRYLRAIEVERGDYNGRVLTIRRSDATALASILGCPPDQVPARLADLSLLRVP